MTTEEAEALKVGDEVYIHYCDIDEIGYSGSINTDGIVLREIMNGEILVGYKDEDFFQDMQRVKSFYPHDLRKIEKRT